MKTLLVLLALGVLVFGALFFSARNIGTEPDSMNNDTSVSEEAVTAEETNTNISDIGTPVDTTTSGRVIDLSGEGLRTVPMEIFENTSATTLDVSNNNLDGALQAEVRHLQNLEVLDLSDNNFTGVPAEVGQLAKLRVLDLSNNPITGLPYELGNLQSLELLDLRGTKYSKQDLDVIKKNLPEETVVNVD